MAQRPCDTCGETYIAKQSNSRFFCDACRAANKGRPAVKPSVVVALPESPGELSAAAEKTLQDAGRLDTHLGQAAMLLARRLEGRDHGLAVASLMKEYRTTMAEALRGAEVREADGLDELRARRDRKRAG